eukprot:6156420-Amphidinium_carterae.1
MEKDGLSQHGSHSHGDINFGSSTSVANLSVLCHVRKCISYHIQQILSVQGNEIKCPVQKPRRHILQRILRSRTCP